MLGILWGQAPCFRPAVTAPEGGGSWGARGWGLRDGGSGPSAPLPSPPRSIHNGVIAVFQRKGLPDQELFGLNEGVR